MTSSIYRSEQMRLCQLFLSSEASYNCLSELGEIGLGQFRDLNPGVNMFQRKFVHEVRRCDDMERILNYIETQVVGAGIEVVDVGDNPVAPQPKEMVDLEATFEKLDNEMREVNKNAEALDHNFLELKELKHVLEAAQKFLDQDPESAANLSLNFTAQEGRSEPHQLGFVAGVIPREKIMMFERMLWRVTRGNAFLRQMDIEEELKDPFTGNLHRKTVYMIYFQGEKLRQKVKKICEGCRSTLYPCPDNAAERAQMIKGVTTRLADLSLVLTQTTDHRERVLTAAAKHLRTWFIKVRKMKAIYHTLNMFNVDITNKCLIAECWIPLPDISIITEALCRGTKDCGSDVEPIVNVLETHLTPPTYFRTNKFTHGFQSLIDAYGVATYREINPGLFTCATFPFLYAVMFGDFGHGMIFAIFALYMIFNEKTMGRKVARNEIAFMLFSGRYIILLMGLFSMYTGFIYNDIFSKSMNLFGSHFSVGTNTTIMIMSEPTKQHSLNPGDPEDYQDIPYIIGMDPIWQLALNKIAFQNSYKMKISIIIGVTHMMFGIVLSLFNNTFFKRTLNIYCEFIPQVIFLMSLFGYLCFLVILKWLTYGDGAEFDVQHGSSCSPAVIITFINMILQHEDPVAVEQCVSNYMFAGQRVLQTTLCLSAVACVPILLLPKPYILKKRNADKMKNRALQDVVVDNNETRSHHNSTTSLVSGASDTAAPVTPEYIEEEFNFGDVFIHQAIHTIEVVLEAVSHTASYLRLWALSLAHAQLSEVLWTMVMKNGLSHPTATGAIWLYLIFAFWTFLTISILVVMEGLSAFLHTLRLHWVEFCSKFYDAQGLEFLPFTFEIIVNPGPND